MSFSIAWKQLSFVVLVTAACIPLIDLLTSQRPVLHTSYCPDPGISLNSSTPPYQNYLYSDCSNSVQVVVTSPLPDSDLRYIGPRLLVAWPAGNNGVVAYFEPQNGINGSLSISLGHNVNSAGTGTTISPIDPDSCNSIASSINMTQGVRMQLELSSPATLKVAILRSIVTIREFTEGPSILHSEIQQAVIYEEIPNGIALKRQWFDNRTYSAMTFASLETEITRDADDMLLFPAGTYAFEAMHSYPRLRQVMPREVFNPESLKLVAAAPDQAKSLSFLAYTDKLLAGGWRFLTYFGRDSMLTALLMQPVLSEGEGGTIEAVLSAVIEHINSTDGSVCHEEIIGDFAAWTQHKAGVLHSLSERTLTTPDLCDYKMVDTDFFLPILLERYVSRSAVGMARGPELLKKRATALPANEGISYDNLVIANVEKIMTLAAPFASRDGQVVTNLIALLPGEAVGQWRDSTSGLGDGRIAFDVNTALMPAALRAISALVSMGYFPTHASWASLAIEYAQIWEDETLRFFEVELSASEANTRSALYIRTTGFNGSSEASVIDEPLTYHAVAISDPAKDPKFSTIEVMHSDTAFRLFLLNTTNESQLTSFINATALSVLRRFPAGLATDVGMLVANPAFGTDPYYAKTFTNSAYHGLVVWSWQLALMARGMEMQLDRCTASHINHVIPVFCHDPPVFYNLKKAYNVLWDSIDANKEHLTTEVWSWYIDGKGNFRFTELGSLQPPDGEAPTESNAVQLWSLAFLAVTRNMEFML